MNNKKDSIQNFLQDKLFYVAFNNCNFYKYKIRVCVAAYYHKYYSQFISQISAIIFLQKKHCMWIIYQYGKATTF